MKVYIAQLLCPARHCCLACAGEFEHAEDADTLGVRLQTVYDAGVRNKELNPWCGICKSRHLNVEVKPTVFRTMAEARPFIAMLQDEQMIARALFGQPGQN